jgi:hypothetical protein
LKSLLLAAGDRPNGRWSRLGNIRAHSNSCHVSQGARNQDRSTRGNGESPYGDSKHGVVRESPPALRELCSPARRITEAVWLLGDAPRTPHAALHLSKKGRRRQATGANGGSEVTVPLEKARHWQRVQFMAGVQCLKRLYLQVHEPELAAQPNGADESIIEQGREVKESMPDRPGTCFLSK